VKGGDIVDITFTTSSTSKALPSKKHINLCLKEKSSINPLVALIAIILIIAGAAAFSKFGVMDRLSEVDRLNGEVNTRQYELDAMNTLLESYDEVYEEYSRYSVSWMNEEERNLVSRTEALSLIDEIVAKSTSVTRITISGNSVSAELFGITLADTSSLVDELKARDNVKDVMVYTASSDDGSSSLVSLVIKMTTEEEETE